MGYGLCGDTAHSRTRTGTRTTLAARIGRMDFVPRREIDSRLRRGVSRRARQPDSPDTGTNAARYPARVRRALRTRRHHLVDLRLPRRRGCLQRPPQQVHCFAAFFLPSSTILRTSATLEDRIVVGNSTSSCSRSSHSGQVARCSSTRCVSLAESPRKA